MKDNDIYKIDLYYDNMRLLKMQKNKEFKNSTLGETVKIGTYGYIKNSSGIVKLKQLIKSSMNVSKKFLEILWEIV